MTTDTYWFMHTYLASGDHVWPFGGKHPPMQDAGPVALDVDPPPGGGGHWMSGPVGGTAGTTSQYLLYGSGTVPSTILFQPRSGSSPPSTDTYALLPDVNFATTGPLHVTTWLSSPPAHQFTLTVPGANAAISGYVASEVRGYRYYPNSVQSTASSSSVVFNAQYPEFGTGTCLGFGTILTGENTFSIVKVLGMPLPSAVSLDLSAEMLPRFATFTRDADLMRPTYSWTYANTGIEGDAFKLDITGDERNLRIILPAGLTRFRMPALPPGYEQTYTQQQRRPAIYAFEANDTAGYADAVSDDRWTWGSNPHRFADGLRFQTMIFEGQS